MRIPSAPICPPGGVSNSIVPLMLAVDAYLSETSVNARWPLAGRLSSGTTARGVVKREKHMGKAIDNLQAAQKRAMAVRPKVGGFPYLAEVFRQAGVTKNLWFLPSCQSLYLTSEGPVVIPGTPLVSGATDVPAFDREALIRALRTDQAGESTFPEFLAATWRAGVIRYDVDFVARSVAYYGCDGEAYIETYPAVEIE